MRSNVKPRLKKFYFWSELDIRVPDSVTSIGRFAFSWSNLSDVTIPASVVSIGADAFTGYRNLTLRVTKGSYAEQYAIDNDLPYIFITDEP